MEVNSYSDLEDTFLNLPAKALNCSSRLILSRNLDPAMTLTTETDVPRDYRGLAELIGFQYHDIRRLREFPDRTMKILEDWEAHPDATVGKLFSFLEVMDRCDVIEELIPKIKKDAEDYFKYQEDQESLIQVNEVTSDLKNSNAVALTVDDLRNAATSDTSNLSGKALTVDDVKTGEYTTYDAYLSYADDDIAVAMKFAKNLESKGLKLFISGRDMLPGCNELSAEIELILHRCRRMLVLLTPNFMDSPALEFQVSFAGHVGIHQRQRILIPVILAPCEIPDVLINLSKVDFTDKNIEEWMWSKLITSLQAEDKMLEPLSSLGRNLTYRRNAIMNSTRSVSSENLPIITFPQSAEHNVSHVNESSPVLNSDEINSPGKDGKDSPSRSGSSKKSHPFVSVFKTLRKSSTASSTSFSTSGYHSKSS